MSPWTSGFTAWRPCCALGAAGRGGGGALGGRTGTEGFCAARAEGVVGERSLERCAAEADTGVDPGLCRRVLGQVRARWVGQCYIRAVDQELRNAEIQAALDAGEPLATVAKRV